MKTTKTFARIAGVVLAGLLVFAFAGCQHDASTTNQHDAGTTSYTITYEFHDSVTSAGTTTINGTDYDLVYFGDFPQTVKASDVSVNEAQSVTMGDLTYYYGSDGNYYAKQSENAYGSDYTYSDGTTVAQSSANSKKYFKVEPIKWRVLNPSADGNKILVAENILTANVAYYDYYNVNRTISDATVYPNNYEHSKIRAYLNGLSYAVKASDSDDQTTDATYNGKGFLQTAFTESAQSLIATTTVDNSAASTNPASNASLWNSGTNTYACENTSDKIFLLSEKEATTESYGFAEYNVYIGSSDDVTTSSRVRQTTDFAKAHYAYQHSTAGYGCRWWLRSPYFNYSSDARGINYDDSDNNDHQPVSSRNGGVVPALCVE